MHREDGSDVPLTDREAELLQYLASRPGQTVPVEQIERDVWGMAPTIVSRAVSATVRRLRPKIEVDPVRVVNLVTVFGVGWRLQVDEGAAASKRSPVRRARPMSSFDAFIGRKGERARVGAALDRGARGVVVHGLPGVGKSRLLLEIAGDLHEAGRAVVWVDMGAVLDGEAAIVALARAIQARPGPTEAEEALRRALEEAGPLDLILDPVVAPRAVLALPGWLHAAPEVRVLVGSRRPLQLPGFERVELGPLSTGDPGEPAPNDDPSLALLMARLRESAIPVLPGDEPTLGRLVRYADGLPLAIELFAGRLRWVTPGDLVEALAREVDASAGEPAAPGRLEVALAGAWDSLDASERATLSAIALVNGPFDVAATAALTGTSVDRAADALERLAGSGMLWSGVAGARTFYLARPVRSFIRRQGEPAPEVTAAYARWALGRAASGRSTHPEELVQAARIGPGVLARDAAIQAASLLRDEGGVSRALALVDVVRRRLGPEHESPLARVQVDLLFAMGRADEAVAFAASSTFTDPDDRVWVGCVHGRALRVKGDLQGALRRYEEVVRVPVSPLTEAYLMRLYGAALLAAGRVDEGQDALDRSLAAARRAHAPDHEAWALVCRAQYSGSRTDVERAVQMVEQAVAAPRVAERVQLLLSGGVIAWHAGDGRGSLTLLERAAQIGRREGGPLGAPQALLSMAVILADQGRFRAAQEALDDADDLGVAGLMESRRLFYLARLRFLQGRLDEADELLRRHANLSLEQNHTVFNLELTAEVRLAQGRVDEALAAARRARHEARRLPPRYMVVPHALVARAYLAGGALQEARQEAARAQETAAETHIPFDEIQAFLVVGEVALALGDIDGVRTAAAWAAPWVESLDLTPTSLLWRRWDEIRRAAARRRYED